VTLFVVASDNLRLGIGLDRRPDILRIAGDGLPRCGVHFAQIGFTEWTAGGKPRHPRFLRPDGVTIWSVFDRLDRVGDPWADFWRRGVSLSRARQRLENLNATRRVP